MKIYSNDSISKKISIEVIFSVESEKNQDLAASVVDYSISHYSQIYNSSDYDELLDFFDDVDLLMSSLQKQNILQIVGTPSSLSNNGLSDYWKFYFILGDKLITDTEYLIDLRVSHHIRKDNKFRRLRDIKRLQKITNNPNQKCKFEEIIVNNQTVKTYNQALKFIEEYLLNLYNTYKRKYSNDDFITSKFPYKGIVKVTNYIADLIQSSGKSLRHSQKYCRENSDIEYYKILENIGNAVVEKFRQTNKSFNTMDDIYDYIDDNEYLIQPLKDYLQTIKQK